METPPHKRTARGLRPVLHDFRIQLPAHRGAHADVVRWLAAAHARSEQTLQASLPESDPRHDPDFNVDAFRRQMERHLRRYAPSPDTVGFRYAELGEFLDEDFSGKELFPLDRLPPGAGTAVRMDAFGAMAAKAVKALYEIRDTATDAVPDAPPDEIIHVTCTGYSAPSAVQTLVEERGWQDRTRITHAYHMGCYAALPSVRIAAGYLASAQKQTRCDIVHTEICSLHLNPSRHDPEQLVVQSLFADGFIRYSLSTTSLDEGGAALHGFEVLGTAERIVPDSLIDIGWAPGDFGMRMSLSRNVPDKIAPHLDNFVTALAQDCGLSRIELDGAMYAVHPGGPRIVDKVQEWLRLEPAQVVASREILFERGNMSSATLPHIWQRLLHNETSAAGTFVVSLAFGPGLTLYGSIMRRV
jgi:predicted naringenin-chalcone synthase